MTIEKDKGMKAVNNSPLEIVKRRSFKNYAKNKFMKITLLHLIKIDTII